jgi:hypothetical protein
MKSILYCSLLCRRGWIVILLVIFAGCGDGAPDREMRELLGKTKPQLIARLGEPDFKNELTGHQLWDEMRAPVGEYLRGRNMPNSTQVLEYQWRSGEYYYAAWMLQKNGEWVTIDAVSWHKSVQF